MPANLGSANKNSKKSSKRKRLENLQSGLLNRGKNYIGGLKEGIRSKPIKQRSDETSGEFRKRQKQQDDESPNNIRDRSLTSIAGQRAKTEANKLKEKGSKITNKAQQIKDDFRNRMSGFKETMQAPPIKQRANETSGEFRRRQKQQDDESPDNIKDRSLGDVAGQRLKTDVNKQIGKGKDFLNKKGSDYFKKHPQAAAAVKEAQEKAETLNKTRKEAIKKLAIKKSEFNRKINRLKAHKNKLKEKFDAIKNLKDDLKRRARQYILKIAISTLSAVIGSLGYIIIIMAFIAAIIMIIYYACDYHIIMDSSCSAFTGAGAL